MARRGYVQLLNEFYENDKIRELRETCPTAVGMFCMILSYCGDKMTDGHIRDRPLKYVLRATDAEIDALCAIGMLEPDGTDGYWVHDYLLHNRSKAQIQHSKKKTNERVKRFRDVNVTALREKCNGVTSDTVTPLHGDCNAVTSGQTPEHQNDISNEISPPVCPPHEGDTQTALFDDSSEPVKPKRQRRAKTTLPDGWTPKPKHRSRAFELGLDLDAEAESFTSSAEANGRTYANWDAAFTYWLNNANKFGRTSPTRSRSQMNLAANMANTWKYMTDEEKARFQGGGFGAFQG